MINKKYFKCSWSLQENTNVKETYAKFIEPRFVDLATGEYTQQADDSQQAIPADADKARIRSRSKTTEVYLVKMNRVKLNKLFYQFMALACGQ